MIPRINQDLTPLYSLRNRTKSFMCVPPWLESLLGVRERSIIYHPQARTLHEDQEGNRYPSHQQWIESPLGTMLIDSQRRAILN